MGIQISDPLLDLPQHADGIPSFNQEDNPFDDIIAIIEPNDTRSRLRAYGDLREIANPDWQPIPRTDEHLANIINTT